MHADLTEAQERLLCHALGLSKQHPKRAPYRNHYVADPGHHALSLLEVLVQKGLMERVPVASFLQETDLQFRVTSAGRQAALSAFLSSLPHRTASQERYLSWRAYCEVYPGTSFGDYLRAGCPGFGETDG